MLFQLRGSEDGEGEAKEGESTTGVITVLFMLYMLYF